jgi:hypothetical protein
LFARTLDTPWKGLNRRQEGLTLSKPGLLDAGDMSQEALVSRASSRGNSHQTGGTGTLATRKPAENFDFKRLDLLMIPMMFFGILGGCLSAAVAFQHGYLAALLAYAIGGAVFALIPGFLRRDIDTDKDRARSLPNQLHFPAERVEIKE